MLLLIRPILKSVYRSSYRNKGFTLLELLVTALIGGAIVSGLLYLTNELLTSDQRESTRTETQRDLNLALEFMSAELQEAIYVYPNAACLKTPGGTDCTQSISGTNVPYIDGTVNIPANSGVPVLAFWKQEPMDQSVVDICTNATADKTGIPCVTGNSYTLVVYSFQSRAQNDEIEGNGAIYRYAMRMTKQTLDNNQYATPVDLLSVKFRQWPHGTDSASFSEPELLVDFVDDHSERVTVANQDSSCPQDPADSSNTDFYQLTPHPEAEGFSDSFYACVKNVTVNAGGATASTTTTPLQADGNQDVVIRLRGNAHQRSALIGEDGFLPALESQILVRGVMNRQL